MSFSIPSLDFIVSWIANNDKFITAGSTVVIAVFTVVLALVALWQGRLIRNQLKLGRDEFRATHRPKLVIRACKISGIDAGADHKWRCKFTYHNEGESTAYIRDVGTRVWTWSEPHTYGDKEIQFHMELSTEVLKSGQDKVHFTKPDFDCDLVEQTWFFAGYVRYSDQKTGGTVRKVGFLRKWDGKPGLGLADQEWVKEPNDEYDYSY